jgi:hypothetical protein
VQRDECEVGAFEPVGEFDVDVDFLGVVSEVAQSRCDVMPGAERDVPLEGSPTANDGDPSQG